MKRILYRLGSSGRDEWMFKIAKELQNHIKHEAFFQCTKLNSDFAIQNKIPPEYILYTDNNQKQSITKEDLDLLREAEKKFNFKIWDVWEVVAQRSRKQRKTQYQKVLLTYTDIIKIYNDFLDKNKITDFIVYGPASSSDIILFKMMKQKGINIIAPEASPLKQRFCIFTDLNQKIYGLEEEYHKIKKRGPTEEEEKEAIEIIKQYHQKNYKPDGAIINCNSTYQESKITKIKRYSKAGWRMIKNRKFPSTFRPLFWRIIEKSYDRFGFFEKPVDGEKFVLFPLHFQPEISTSWYGKWYDDQLNIISNIVRSLPVSYKLYVKEHHFGYGNRNPKFYREIKKYVNVRLISPHVNNLELIEKASLVTTITGTTGWEAIMFQKPVIVFGDVYYDIFNCVKKIRNIRELSEVVSEIIDKKIKSNEVITCITSVVRSTYPGLFILPADCNNYSLKDENIKKLVKGITTHINKI